MNIALCHFRAGKTDGVSLEMEKWKLILEKLGHNVFILGGSLGSLSEGSTITELQYTHPVNLKIVKNSYGPIIDYNNENALSEDISNLAVIIEKNQLYNNETFTDQSRIVYLIADKVESDSHYLKQLIRASTKSFFCF